MKRYVTYIRVSTQKQGRSGLGLDAQRKMCGDFVNAHQGEIVKEFMDVESGTHRNRKGLQDAITYCKQQGTALVIAKLDRLARDVEFCFKVVNTGIEIHFTDMPQMNTLLLGVFASVAQYERELTSDRTKKALAVKKAAGASLGAASPTYQARRAQKSIAMKKNEAEKSGASRTRHYQDSKDVSAFTRVLKNVFPKATKKDSPSEWYWGMISLKADNCTRVLGMMRDYKEMDSDGSLFHNWDFSQDNKQKLRSYMQAFKKSSMRANGIIND